MAERWKEIRRELADNATRFRRPDQNYTDVAIEIACKCIANLEAEREAFAKAIADALGHAGIMLGGVNDDGSEECSGVWILAERIAALEAELAKHRWIPVEERLPDTGVWVHVWRRGAGLLIATHNPSGHPDMLWWVLTGGWAGDDVTHWRPLPEGPKEANDD